MAPALPGLSWCKVSYSKNYLPPREKVWQSHKNGKHSHSTPSQFEEVNKWNETCINNDSYAKWVDKTTLRQFQFYYNQTKQRPSLPSLCHPSASREETVESLESNSAVFAGRPLHDGHQKQPGEMRRGSCPSYLPPLPHLNISCQLRQRMLQSQILNTMGNSQASVGFTCARTGQPLLERTTAEGC